MNYWLWLIKGYNGKPGYKTVLNRWFIVHLTIGWILSLVVPVSLKDTSNSVLLPLAGILVGLSFAWAANGLALLQTEEIALLSEKVPGGLRYYAYLHQTAMLIILTALVLWGFAGLSIFDVTWPTKANPEWYGVVSAVMFTLSSLAVRECWNMVLFAQSLLIARAEIVKALRQRLNRENSDSKQARG